MSKGSGIAIELAQIGIDLCRSVQGLSFTRPVSHVYNPLSYAWAGYRAYLDLARPEATVLLVGMNPGPWGMVQNGVPFGDQSMVQHWLGIKVQVARPDHEHPKRPIQGLDCPRKEISGQRLWGWAKGRFKTPESFFGRFFVINYCPLAFLEQTGRNRTPDRLPVQERRPLFAKCDAALARTIDLFAPKWVLGIGKTAASRAELVSQALEVSVSSVPHPSPASPLANQGWAGLMDNRLKELGCLQD